jgi:hypothetical protein
MTFHRGADSVLPTGLIGLAGSTQVEMNLPAQKITLVNRFEWF